MKRHVITIATLAALSDITLYTYEAPSLRPVAFRNTHSQSDDRSSSHRGSESKNHTVPDSDHPEKHPLFYQDHPDLRCDQTASAI